MSCVATASSRIVESNARRVLPASTPVSATTSRTASKIRFGAMELASRRRQYVNVVGWNAAASTANPHAAFHRRSNVTASAASRSESPCNACSTSTVATTTPERSDGHARHEQISEHHIREQLLPLPGQKSEHAARRQQMPRNRLNIHQIPLWPIRSLHTPDPPGPLHNSLQDTRIIQQSSRPAS